MNNCRSKIKRLAKTSLSQNWRVAKWNSETLSLTRFSTMTHFVHSEQCVSWFDDIRGKPNVRLTWRSRAHGRRVTFSNLRAFSTRIAWRVVKIPVIILDISISEESSRELSRICWLRTWKIQGTFPLLFTDTSDNESVQFIHLFRSSNLSTKMELHKFSPSRFSLNETVACKLVTAWEVH